MSGANRSGALGAALIALGVIWFLVATGAVGGGWLARLTDLWPLLLVGLGLDLIGPERAERLVLGLPWTAVAAAVALLLAILYPAADAGPAQTREVRVPLGGAERAAVRLEPGGATLDLTAWRGDDPLLVGEIRDRGVRVAERGRRVRRVDVTRRASAPAGAGWVLELADGVPVDLELDGGSGTSRLDLTRLDLAGLALDLASGGATIDLPLGGPERNRIELDGGSGRVRLRAPEGSRFELDAELGSGGLELTVGRGSDAEIELEGGSGTIVVDLPDAAAVRLEVEDDGSGELRVPTWLTRTAGRGETGVWQSASWRRDAAPAVTVRIDDAGSGRIELR